MKSALFISIIALCGATSAMATPVVGDSATYTITLTSGGQSQSFQGVDTVSAINASADQFTDTMVISQGGTQVQSQANTDSLSQATQMEGIVSLCPQIAATGQYDSATVETINVPAGNFQACHVVKANQIDLYLGDVPFSIIQGTQNNSDGSTVSYSLTAFKKN